MADPDRGETPSRLSTPMVECLSALFFILVGVVVAFDSRRIGAGWADDGPQAGYFPFYIGLALTAAGVFALIDGLRGMRQSGEAFATREQLARVAQVFLPTCVYVLGISLIGIYFASALFIAYFMRRHGRFAWALVAAISIGLPMGLFMLFERWFLVPLPKGPIERLLGF